MKAISQQVSDLHSPAGLHEAPTESYGDKNPDRLTRVVNAASATKGFKYNSSATSLHYTYDNNGNLNNDKHKGLFLGYNHLNLPNYVSNAAEQTIVLTYTADGEKLTKISPAGTRNYVAGIEYLGANLEAIYHAEGRCTPNGATAFHYEYTLKDHLGNARVNFRANGTAVVFIEDMHYYPFGMLMEGIGTAAVTVNKYKYNGKELNDDLGLNLSDYGARWYDAALGRWWSVDPLAEKYQRWSAYHYALNNPMRTIDPNGRQAKDIIIRYSEGMTDEQKRNYDKQISTILGNLTDDKISIKNGKVAIEEKIDNGTKKNATRLIRGFIEGMSVKGKPVKRDVTITPKAKNQGNSTTVIDIYSNNPEETTANASNGTGVSNSIIAFDPENPDGKGFYPAGGGEKATASNEMALMHELVHAFRNAMGIRASVARGSCPNCKRGEHVTAEEAKVQTIMNEKFQPENAQFIQLTEDPYNN